MRATDADNAALLAQARARALALQELVERQRIYGDKYDELYCLAQDRKNNPNGLQYKNELWALSQAIYLCAIEIRERTRSLNDSVRLLASRTGETSSEIRRLIEPPFTGV